MVGEVGAGRCMSVQGVWGVQGLGRVPTAMPAGAADRAHSEVRARPRSHVPALLHARLDLSRFQPYAQTKSI